MVANVASALAFPVRGAPGDFSFLTSQLCLGRPGIGFGFDSFQNLPYPA